jgi:OmpA-OmpF porin, OOP family
MFHRLGMIAITAVTASALLSVIGGNAANAQLIALPSGPGAWYFGGEGGWTHLEAAQASATIPVIGFRSDRQTWSDGYNAGVHAGYEWGPWRFEEEFRYQNNGDLFLVNSGGRGSYTAAAIMSNLLYDFLPDWILSPHIGGGIGAVDLSSSLNVGGLGQVITGSDWVFGYQAIGGVRYNINPIWALDVDYRYLATATPHFHTGGNFVDDMGLVHAPGIPVASAYASHSVVASLSFRFGAPPPPLAAPPAPPAPPPVVRKVFLVFFDWDKDTITPEGMQIVQQAAAAFHAGAPAVTIQVTGYTDRSGSPGYNQRLSERRANNVANALQRFGVPRQAMVVSGRGENDNRVPTAPGVREPQNRRVEIVF